jgi:hypothetical protein
MNFLEKILEKLGLKKGQSGPTPATTSGEKKIPTSSGMGGKQNPAIERQKDDSASASNAVSEVDVVRHLEQLSKDTDLDWKISIVDLLKLLKIDSSHEARNELAKELGCPADLMSDSAKMNTWLHKSVLRKIAENGGNIPPSLLD